MRKKVISLFLSLTIISSLFSSLSIIANAESHTPISKMDWNGHTYHVYDESMTWEEAKQYCENSGGHLVTITSEEEQKVIENLLTKGSLKSYWLGAECKEKVFNWITGEAFSYCNWEPGQPDGSQNDMYIQIYNLKSSNNLNYKWDDTWNAGDRGGGLKNQGFICEWDDNADETLSPIATTDWNGHTYHVYDESMTWEEAKLYCENLGGHLVTITSEDENNEVFSLLQTGNVSKDSYWIGSLKNKNNSWGHITGECFVYNNWGSGEPNDTYNNEAVIQYIYSDYKKYNNSLKPKQWNDLSPNGSNDSGFKLINIGFICEFEGTDNFDKPTTNAENPILKAKKLINNHEYNFYKDSDVPHTIIANAIGDASLMKGYYSLTEDILKGKSTDFYEIILYEIFVETGYTIETIELVDYAVNDSAVADFIKAYKEIDKDFSGILGDLLDKEMDWGDVVTQKFNDSLSSSMSSKIGWTFKGTQFAAKTYGDILDMVTKAYSFAAVSDVQIDALSQIVKHTNNYELKSAAQRITASILLAKQNAFAEMVADNFTDKAYELAFKKVKDTLVDSITKKWPQALMYKYAYKTGKFIADNVYNASELSYDALSIIAINEIDKAMVSSLDVLKTDLNNSPTTENAEILIVMADAYKDLILYGDDICISYVEGVKQGQVKSNAFENFLAAATLNPVLIAQALGGKDADCDHVISSLNSIDWCVEISDWYSGFEDYSKYMTVVRSTHYSSWATESIKGAKVLGFLPEYLECNYTESITRAEFATFLVNFIERKSGKSVYSLLEENELPMISVPFDDALFIDVDYAYRLGIIKGKGEGKFDPLAEITREEAAVMLTRTVKLLGYDTIAFNYNLPGGISSWANDSVNFVYEKGIMQGDETGFNPKGNITKEQTIATLYRIFYNI